MREIKRFKNIRELAYLHARMKGFIHRTPVITSASFNDLTKTKTFFKCENFQKMGAFKMRGAISALLNLTDEQKQRGVATHSSGNFAQAVALSARLLGVKAVIVMPKNAPEVKKDAVRGYGGEIVECASGLESRVQSLDEVVSASGAEKLHPSNQREVIEGNSTAVMELLEDVPDLDVVITPVGGGGLLAGTALAAKQLKPDIQIHAGEPFAVDDAYRSIKSGVIQPPTNKSTVADGLKTCLGDVNFPLILEYVDSIIRVTEDEIISAMKWIWERLKIVIEASAAVPVAAVLREKELFTGKRIGIILSGGNVELDKLPFKEPISGKRR